MPLYTFLPALRQRLAGSPSINAASNGRAKATSLPCLPYDEPDSPCAALCKADASTLSFSR